jgi:methyl acetate hydrolase
MAESLKSACDAVLRRTVSGMPRVPGVVAMATGRNANIYEGAAGKRVLGQDADMTADSVFAIYSATKAVAATSVLQCVEDGLIDLDAPAKRYAPEIGELQVLDGIDAGGRPKLRPPKRDITTRMLMLHTSGLGYGLFNETYGRLAAEHGWPSTTSGRLASLMTPLLFDPGERWEYGSNIDWCGQIVERVRGQRLGEVLRERLLEPLGMHDTAFTMTPAMRERLTRIHQRDASGDLTPLDLELPQDPDVHMGGHGLYSTVGDYMKFIRMWLNDGAGPDGPVLRPETVRAAARNGIGVLRIRALPTTNRAEANEAEFFPGIPKSWAYSFMVNEEDAPTGRPAGALGWAGLANCYFWIDRQNGIGGFWATQILPFADEVSFGGYLEFETAVYRTAVGLRAL